MTRSWKPDRIALALFVVVLVLAVPFQAKAITFDMFVMRVEAAIQCTLAKKCTDAEEQTMKDAAAKAYDNEQALAMQPTIGQAFLNGQATGGILNPGTPSLLTFEYVDPSTLLQTSGPPTAEVSYAYSQTPSNPASFTFLGDSNNPATNFELPFTSFSIEEAIIATPLDSAGAPIFIPDIDGVGNVAPGLAVNLIPEPGSLTLLAIGLLGLGAMLGRGAKRV
jgi:hypothetical protein